MSDGHERGPDDRNRWLAHARAVIALAVTAAILVALARLADLNSLAAILRSLDARLALAAVAMMAVVVLLVAIRWRVTLAANGVRVALGESVGTILSASALNSISPSKAGDLIKVYAVRRHTNASVALGAMLAERIVDIAVLGVIAAPAALSIGRPELAAAGAVLALAPPMVIPALHVLQRLPLPAKLEARLEQFAGASRKLIAHPGLLGLLGTLTFAIWGLMLAIAWLLYHAVGAAPSFAQVAAAFPAAAVAAVMPFTVAGIGTRDAVLMFLLAGAATRAQSLAATLMYTCVVYWGPALGGAPIVLHLLSARQKTASPAHG
jgi:uncharacterized membrane protein YbhN (UPF0104 family)